MNSSIKKPATTAPTADAESKSIPERSIQTAYIAKSSLNTYDTLGTFSEKQLPRGDYIGLVVSMDLVIRIMNGHPVLFQIDPDDVEANNREFERIQEEKEAKRLEEEARLQGNLKRRISDLVHEKYEQEYKRLDDEAELLYTDLNAKVKAEIQSELDRLEVKK